MFIIIYYMYKLNKITLNIHINVLTVIDTYDV